MNNAEVGKVEKQIRKSGSGGWNVFVCVCVRRRGGLF